MIAPLERDPFTPDARQGALFPRWLWWALLSLIFIAGLGVRLYDLADPPLDFHPTRQLHSALIARGMYMEQRENLPGWQREMAVSQWRMEGLIEPQVFERLAAWTYNLTGSLDLRIPRLYAILFWITGAVFVVWLAAGLAGRGGALAAALFFLFWPYGVIASRAFHPEPIFLALSAAALWSAVRWMRCEHWAWAVTAGLLAGLAIYIKSVALFLLGPALAAVVLGHFGLRGLRSRQVWAMACLALLPFVLYHLDGVYLRGYLTSQFSLRFFPAMWIDPAFYLRWISNLGRVMPFEMVLATLGGAFLLRRPAERVLVLSMWAGYFVYGMTLPHHISTHDYYHLPLLAALVINAYSARTTLKRFDAAGLAHTWTEIGQFLGPGSSVTALVDDYGSGLKYWGWVNPAIWPTADDASWRASIGQEEEFEARFAELAAGKDFFVVTLLDDLERQPELKTMLYERYPVLQQSQDYVIFDLRAHTQN
jgi:hypothetical protein